MSFYKKLITASIFSLAIGLNEAKAASVVDQRYDVDANVYSLIYRGNAGIQSLGQTFTVGLGGALTGFDIFLPHGGAMGSLSIEVRNTVADTLGPVILASSGLFNSSSISGPPDLFYHVDLTTPFLVAPGLTLGFDLQATPGSYFNVGEVSGAGAYSRGSAQFSSNGSTFASMPRSDLLFRTYVNTAVPGPIAGAGLVPLLGLGLVALRRRKKLAA